MSTATAEHTETARVVMTAWDAYRRSQDVPAPACGHWGELTRAQRELHDLTAPYASGERETGLADLAAIAAALDGLMAVVRRHCGPQAAQHVKGGSEEEGAEAA